MTIKAPARRILIIKTRSIGDTVLLTGVLRVLHRQLPNHALDVVVHSPGGELLENIPYVDRVICVQDPKSKFARFAYWMRIAHRLRERRYEYVLNFHASKRTAGFAHFLRAEKVIANNHDLFHRNWFSDEVVPGRGVVKSILDRDCDVLRALGIEVNADECLPEIRLSIAEQRISTKRINDVIPEKGLKIFFGIGGSRDTKRWPAEHFANLARTILKQFDAQFVFTLVPGDSEWVENFKKYFLNDHEAAKRLHFFKDLTLREAAGVISKCDYYVGNDSSLKHIAIAFDLPTFTFFGPEEPLEWHPYHISHHPYAFIKNLECRTESGKHWCTISSCVKHKHQCLAGIVPESVLPIILSQCEKIQDIKLK